MSEEYPSAMTQRFDRHLPSIEKIFGKVKALIHEMEIPYIGWEMDNYGWICEMEDGTKRAFITNHGGSIYEMSTDEIISGIDSIRDNLMTMVTGLSMLNSELALNVERTHNLKADKFYYAMRNQYPIPTPSSCEAKTPCSKWCGLC